MVISKTDAPDYIELSKSKYLYWKKKAKNAAVAVYYCNAFALIKLREKKAAGVIKVPSCVFKCILDYCEPAYYKRVTDHKYESRNAINHIWP